MSMSMLLPGKSRQIYARTFLSLKQDFLKRDIDFEPLEILGNFELALPQSPGALTEIVISISIKPYGDWYRLMVMQCYTKKMNNSDYLYYSAAQQPHFSDLG